VFRGAVNEDWDGSWTLLAFSLPDSSQRERHSLRSRLAWAGSGPLIGGLWIAPGHADVRPITEAPDFGGQVRVFRSTADPSTDVPAMVRQVWDLDTPAADYRAFAERWRALASGEARCADELAARLRLRTEWLRIVRADPRLPAAHLPAGWPAAAAQDVFRRADARLDAPARAQAHALLDTNPAAGT
jgi:phenylacetic acid degradation operon negative regulatory protein